jgi:hypothetical protein
VLRSGGPLMLVLEVATVGSDHIAHVRWIDAKAQEREAEFPFSMLKLIEQNAADHSRLLTAFFSGQPLKSMAVGDSKAKPAA